MPSLLPDLLPRAPSTLLSMDPGFVMLSKPAPTSGVPKGVPSAFVATASSVLVYSFPSPTRFPDPGSLTFDCDLAPSSIPASSSYVPYSSHIEGHPGPTSTPLSYFLCLKCLNHQRTIFYLSLKTQIRGLFLQKISRPFIQRLISCSAMPPLCLAHSFA